MTNRVWIELDRPDAGDHATAHARAKLASAMLTRLGVPPTPQPVWWHEKNQNYCFVLDGAGSYTEASDNGHWFNLDYFGREIEA